jgi:hypothetical protein
MQKEKEYHCIRMWLKTVHSYIIKYLKESQKSNRGKKKKRILIKLE